MLASYIAERASGNNTAPGSTQNITVSGNCAADNTIFLVMGARDTSTAGCSVSDSRSNTWTIDLGPLNANNDFICIASTRQNTAVLQNNDTVTFTFGTTPDVCGWFLEEVSGLLSASYLDKTASKSTGVGGTAADTGTTAATVQPDEVAIGAFCIGLNNTGACTVTPDATWSQFTTTAMEVDPSGWDKEIVAQYKIPTATGTQVCSITYNQSGAYQAMIATYKALVLPSRSSMVVDTAVARAASW